MSASATMSETLARISAEGRPASDTARFTIRWVLAHDPPIVFEDACRQFIETVRERTHGEVEVQLLTSDAFMGGRGGEDLSRTELVQCLARGEVEMAHTYVSTLGSVHEPLWALELPFLFRDYDHAEKVLEGPMATRLMDDMAVHGIRGLSFAYSGGFRILPSTGRRIEQLSDLAGLRIRTSGNPIPAEMYRRMGAIASPGALQHVAKRTLAGEIDAAELTFVRFLYTGLNEVYKVVNDTGHSLFMTMMAINEEFFRGLPEGHQEAIVEAGRRAGQIERGVSLAEEVRVKQALPELGVEIVSMDEARRAEFREVARSVYESFAPRFGQDIVDAVRST
ncbi:MAG: TRAP transporter substrate-binding protein [Planctomycetes bacterium]|nr:TRAP transporter substrate-binding protein [Planctomycetota bacterium]